MSEIIEQNKAFLVKSKYGTYIFNNRQAAEQLYQTLSNYENITNDDLITDYETKISNLRQKVIHLQMTISILQNEIDQMKKELNI